MAGASSSAMAKKTNTNSNYQMVNAILNKLTPEEKADCEPPSDAVMRGRTDNALAQQKLFRLRVIAKADEINDERRAALQKIINEWHNHNAPEPVSQVTCRWLRVSQ